MIDEATHTPQDLVTLVKAKMEREHLSLGALERMTGVTRQSLTAYFKGKTPTQFNTRQKLADFLNADINHVEGNERLPHQQHDWRALAALSADVEHWKKKYELLLEIMKDMNR